MTKFSALVLAGGPADEISARTPGAPNKAFAEIAGLTLVERTLRALRAAQGLGRIVVVAPRQMHRHSALALADDVRDDGARVSDSLASGLSALARDDRVLVSASDLPVLSACAIDDYLERAAKTQADLTYGCIERQVHLAKYPDVPHTWARLRDGTYCGTGFVTMETGVWPSLERFIERLGRARKNPLALARLFGPGVLLRFVTSRLRIRDAEARASRVIGAPVRAVISPYPEIGVNVDRVSDLALAERLVRAQADAR